MVEEKLKEIVYHIKSHKLDAKNRKREIIDRRSYLIGYLYHCFLLSEDYIASLFNKDRSTVNFHKNKIYDLMTDELFLRNTLVERQLFPLSEETIGTLLTIKQKAKINNGIFSVKLNQDQLLKLNKFIVDNQITDFNKIVAELINKFL